MKDVEEGGWLWKEFKISSVDKSFPTVTAKVWANMVYISPVSADDHMHSLTQTVTIDLNAW